MQVKIFTDAKPETAINAWLGDNPTIQIVNMFTNTTSCGTRVSHYFFHTVTIVYRTLVTAATANQPAVYE